MGWKQQHSWAATERFRAALLLVAATAALCAGDASGALTPPSAALAPYIRIRHPRHNGFVTCNATVMLDVEVETAADLSVCIEVGGTDAEVRRRHAAPAPLAQCRNRRGLCSIAAARVTLLQHLRLARSRRVRAQARCFDNANELAVRIGKPGIYVLRAHLRRNPTSGA